MIKLEKSFDLKSTITCGQIFRYEEISNGYIVILNDRIISIIDKDNYYIVESNNEENLEHIVNDYFDLNRDYNKICKSILKVDNKLKNALEYGKGLRIIHQNPFETIIEYVISQNNRVPSIANSLNLLANKYGKKVIFKNKEYYLFPTPNDLKNANVENYRNCKVGFRDKYLYEIVNSINNNVLKLDDINFMKSDEALNYLMSFKGIGMKVSSCILLFAYQKFDVFPVDTWVKKFMKDDYNIEGEANIKKFASEKYKEYSGLAIQYMFNYKRNNI